MSEDVPQAPQTAVIAGASSGIGAATARALAAKGYEVHLIARREAELKALAEEIGGSYVVADLSDPAAVQRAVDALPAEIGVALYAAGVLAVSTVAEHPIELWEQTIAINLNGAFYFARAIVDRLVPGARLLFISSQAGGKGLPYQSAYAASKGGLERLAESLQGELEPAGVTVNVVVPGPSATPMLDIPGTSPFQIEPERVAEAILHLIELPTDVVLRRVQLRAPLKGPFADPRH